MLARTRVLIKIVVVLIFAVVVAAQRAEASSIILQISDGASTVTIGPATPSGAIFFTGSIGAWNINNVTGIGESALGPGSMDLNSVNVSTTGTLSTLTIAFTMFDINTVYPGFSLEFGGTLTRASVTYSGLYSGSNAWFTGTQFASLGPFSTSPFSGTASGLISVPGTPYSLTQVFTIRGLSATQPVSFSGDGELNALPEPGSMILLGTGLFGIGVLARRRLHARRSTS